MKTYSLNDAMNLIGAIPHGGRYAYHANETDEWICFTAAELLALQREMNDGGCADAYSRWCGGIGEVVTDPAVQLELQEASMLRHAPPRGRAGL